MDKFDELYNEKLIGLDKETEDEGDNLLNEKRNHLYDFFSNQKTFALLVLLGIGLLLTLSSGLMQFSIPYVEGMGSSIIISTGISVVIAGILPYALFMLYTGSKEKNPDKFKKGLKTGRSYVQMIKVITIVYFSIVGVLCLVMMFIEPTLIIAVILIALMLLLVFYIIRIFKDFVEGLTLAFNKPNSLVPSVHKITVIFIIGLVLSVIGVAAVIISYEWVLVNYADQLQNIDTSGLPYGMDPAEIINSIINMRFVIYIAALVQILVQVFYLSYLKSFERTFQAFNAEHRRKVKRTKELEFEAQE